MDCSKIQPSKLLDAKLFLVRTENSDFTLSWHHTARRLCDLDKQSTNHKHQSKAPITSTNPKHQSQAPITSTNHKHQSKAPITSTNPKHQSKAPTQSTNHKPGYPGHHSKGITNILQTNRMSLLHDRYNFSLVFTKRSWTFYSYESMMTVISLIPSMKLCTRSCNIKLPVLFSYTSFKLIFTTARVTGISSHNLLA